MSDSRYLNSPFCVYPISGDVVCVDCEHEFTVKQLTDDMEKCIAEVLEDAIDNPRNLGHEKTKEELAIELRRILQRFLDDDWLREMEAEHHGNPKT